MEEFKSRSTCLKSNRMISPGPINKRIASRATFLLVEQKWLKLQLTRFPLV